MSRIPPSFSFAARFILLALTLWGCAPLGRDDVDLAGLSLGLEDPTAKFVAAASSNFKYGTRGKADVKYIVVHTMEGYYNGSISWFQNPSSKVSAHYLVRSSDGEVTQMVDVSDVAYHDACFNAQSVGIEHEGFVKAPDTWYTDAMYESSARLSAWLAESYGIPLDRSHILGHGETDDCSDHTDPGPGWDWDRYMTLIREAAEPTLAAKLVQYEVPSSLAPGETAKVWFELSNESSDVFDNVRTRIATAEPVGRESPLFVAGAWLSKSSVAPPDTALIEKGALARFTFPIVAPALAEGSVVREVFQLVHEGRTFGPLLTVEFEVRSQPSGGPAPEAPSEDGGAGLPPDTRTTTDMPEASDGGVDVESTVDAVSAEPISGSTCSAAPANQRALGTLVWLSVLMLLAFRNRKVPVLVARAAPRRPWNLVLLPVLLLSCAERESTDAARDNGQCSNDCVRVGEPGTEADASIPSEGTEPTPEDGNTPTPPDGAVATDTADLLDIPQRREMRGVWIASVGNINFPSAQGLSIAAQKAEIDALVDSASKHGINALFFQVRPEADALYKSDLEPWSRYLTGTQGKDPGYDPLAYVIERAHARAIELHAWLNPYRASSSATKPNAASHVANTLSSHVRKYGSLLWLDPGVKAVQEHTRAVVRDLVTRYAVDGIHFDDYFYPYPDGTAFPDASTYSAYKNGGGTLSLGDFRRDAVHTLVRGVSEDLRATKPHVVFGISPFGIYRPGMPQGIEGLDQYAEIYADPLKWVSEGWVDYLAPQLYWPTTQTKQAYEKLLDFWAQQTDGRCLLFAGNNASNLGKAGWSLSEMTKQVTLGRVETRASHGNVFFTIAAIANNVVGFGDKLAQDLYAQAVLTPPALRLLGEPAPAYPRVTLEQSVMHWDADPDARAYVIYRQVKADWVLARIMPGDAKELRLEAGAWAISRLALSGRESRAVRVVVSAP